MNQYREEGVDVELQVEELRIQRQDILFRGQKSVDLEDLIQNELKKFGEYEVILNDEC